MDKQWSATAGRGRDKTGDRTPWHNHGRADTRIRPSITRTSQSAFTLVELLVVITIIAILVALLLVGASAAMKTAARTQIKTEIDQIHTAIESYSQDIAGGSYPPNTVTDGSGPVDELRVLNELRRHLRRAFPRHREPDDLLKQLVDEASASNTPLAGGMSAGEAAVFWLSGFSSDPEYPISGPGGPSYAIGAIDNPDNVKLDPIESRNWIYEFKIDKLGPRDEDGFFDDQFKRSIEYNSGQYGLRRINFWQYAPGGSAEPVLYFDVSRGDPYFDTTQGTTNDSPAGSPVSQIPLPVYAIKTLATRNIDGQAQLVPRFANQDKFQLLSCGIDDEWGDFSRMALVNVSTDELLVYPEGPFTSELADTIANFSDRTLEDSQP